ncbi:unnamed protein product [Caenorhabditis auriculariae]|uniref:TNFR-Cys domain-containing protein n=1 Tax=Caenorhabditis auriculariae TaxID=2777116 RepID=A0A8S1H042_9PELO|nr:unnamed protein product [Caenorhabditis auriculariae]
MPNEKKQWRKRSDERESAVSPHRNKQTNMSVVVLRIVASLLFLTFIQRCECGCRTVYCPQISSTLFPCDNCHTCLEKSSRLCFTSNNATCGCATAVPAECTRNPSNTTAPFIFCFIADDAAIPVPEVKVHEGSFVSAVVPRFFSNPPFDVVKPSFLYLLASFPKEGSQCKSIGHIEAYERGAECLLRIRLHMPSIDYTGHDNYYYDDRSPLETQLSSDLFGKKKSLRFWSEVTLTRKDTVKDGHVHFASVLKSPSTTVGIS